MSNPKITIFPSRKVLTESLVVMKCEVSTSYNIQKLKYTWFFNNSLLRSSVGNNMLTFQKAVMDNIGEYTCRVEGLKIGVNSTKEYIQVVCKLN